MKKRFFLAVAFFALSLGLPGSALAACSGQLEEVGYAITDPDNVYTPGEQVNTSLSFKITGDATENAQKLTTVLVMDVSGSMDDQDRRQAQEALNAAVDALAENTATRGFEHEVGLVYFDDDIYKKYFCEGFSCSYLTSDYGAAYSAIETLSETGGGDTNIGGALYDAAEILANFGDSDSKKTIVLASDGLHNTGRSISSGITKVDDETTVYTVGAGLKETSWYDPTSWFNDAIRDLEDIAWESGTKEGEYFSAGNMAQLKEVFADIIKRIIEFEARDTELSFYRENLINLGYQSANPAPISGETENPMVWSLGNFSSDDQNNINISFNAISSANPVLINQNILKINYQSAQGEICTIEVEIPQLEIVIVDGPELDFYAVDLNGAPIDEINSGNNFQLHWIPENVSFCQASNNAENTGWDNSTNPSHSGGSKELEASTPPSSQEFYLECWNDYGASVSKQVDLEVNPCTESYSEPSCVYGSVVDCADYPCGVSIEKPWVGCSKVKTTTCNGTIMNTETIYYGRAHCESEFGMSEADCSETEQCPSCRDVDSWIEVAP